SIQDSANIVYPNHERDRIPILVYSMTSKEASIRLTQLPVRAVFRRFLPFYPPGWYIYKFECDISRIVELDSYRQNACLFAVGGPVKTDEIDWTVLDWSSLPI